MSIANLQAHYPNATHSDLLFKPVRLCQRQWKNLTSPLEQNKSRLKETLQRILLIIPLLLVTLAACLFAIPGFLTRGVTINLGSPTGKMIKGSNHLATRKIDLSAVILQAVELRSMGNVSVTYEEQEQYVRITGDDNLLDYLTPRLKGRMLIMGPSGRVSISSKNPISYHLHISNLALNKLSLSGSGSIEVAQIETQKLKCQISGQGTVSIHQGHTHRQTIAISGQGSYRASNFKAKNSQINISGQGNARVHTSQSLDVTISGMGSCIYYGAPLQIHQQISGIGDITSA